MALTNIARFESFFRRAAGLDIDKEDLRRYQDFVHRKIYDLLLRGEANAKANGRDVLQPSDLPITRGLQECIHAFRKIDDEALQIESILRELAQLPPLDLAYGEEIEAKLPEVAGGLSYALARAFKDVYPELKNPAQVHWDTLFRLFDLLV